MINILVVEDDLKQNQIICEYLNSNGYFTYRSKDGTDALNTLASSLIDIIISDIMMPGLDGFELAEMVRNINKRIPILFISARDDIVSKQKGFRIGIDDYMVKPVDLEEMLLRVGALVRRANIEEQKKMVIGDMVLDANELSANLNGEDIPLSVREFGILFKLLSYPKQAFTRSQLIDEFWGMDSESGLRSVDVYVTKLREKFSQSADFEIVTVRGFGYKAILKSRE
ncbi:MAG: response regulator transcription factor [Lachnotalea sp.]